MQAAPIALMLAAAVLAPARAGEPAHPQGNWRAGIEVGRQVDARDLGLPRYHGAFERPHQGGDRSSLKLGLHGGAFVYKAGVPGNFRAVAVDRADGLTRIQLVRLRLEDD